MAQSDFTLRMIHPTLPDHDPVPVTKRQFEVVYKPAGWKLAPKPKKGDK